MTTVRDTERSPSTERASRADATCRRRIGWALGAALLVAVYWTLLRERMLTWGATSSEVHMQFPGDDLLSDPDAQSTMAVDIDASPHDVWPWLRQLGQDRGGFYSYEWAENLVGLDIHNADRIVAEWQDLSVGDTVRLGSADRFPDATLKVAAVDPKRSLVLRTPDEPTWWVWSFVLTSVDETTTRLLVRSRIRLPENTVIRLAALSVLDPVSFVMTRGMLLGVRARAERHARRRPDTNGSDAAESDGE